MTKSNPKHAKHARPAADESGTFQPDDATQSISNNDADFGATQAMPVLDEAYAPSGYTPVVSMPSGQFENFMPEKKGKGKKIAAIVCGSIVGFLLLVYIVGTIVFSMVFFPNTTIGTIDASLKTSDQVTSELAATVNSYTLQATAPGGFTYKASGSDIGLTMDAASVAAKMHELTPGWQWPVELVKSLTDGNDLSDVISASFNENTVATNVTQAVTSFNEKASQPENATIAYNSSTKQFEVKKESAGTALNSAEVLAQIKHAIADLKTTLTMGNDVLIQPTVFSTDSRLTDAAKQANAMIKAKLTLTLAGKEATVIDADVIAPLVQISDDLKVTLDDASISALATTIADGLNTVGSERTYTRADGKVITVSGGDYGWQVNSSTLVDDIVAGVKNGETKTIDIPCTQEGQVWTGVGQRDWGNRYIDVDLSEQHAYMYDENGALIWESDIVSGIPDGEHDTSVGVFDLGPKKSPCTLYGYSGNVKIYESVVSYWMPFDGNAIGLHDADWQAAFGGTRYADGYGSHGCVNLPVSAAASLWDLCEDGDVVVSHW